MAEPSWAEEPAEIGVIAEPDDPPEPEDEARADVCPAPEQNEAVAGDVMFDVPHDPPADEPAEPPKPRAEPPSADDPPAARDGFPESTDPRV